MKPKFYRKILKNGMVVLLEKRDTPVVSVAFAVRCGGINESGKERGISHFIEHMLYKGTPKRDARKIAQEIEGKGGDIDGFTDETITAYWCKIPSKHLNVALDVLGDLVKNPVFDEKEIEKERHVIFEEIKMHQDNPLGHSLHETHNLLYKKPFGTPLIGTRETLSSLTREKILKRFKEVYQPNNMVLCVVGNADFEKIVSFTEKNFGKDKGKVPSYKVVKKNESKTEERRGIDQANLVFSYHIPLATDKKNYAAFILNVLMSGGMSSRLFNEIRMKRNMAYAVKGETTINRDFAYSFVYVGTTKENLGKVKKIILEEFKKVSESLTEKELSHFKEQVIGNHQISTEDSQNQMVNLLLHEINGDAREVYKFDEKVKNIKLKDVKDIAKQVIQSHSFFSLIPK